jgi:hypothetical protein
LGVNAGFLVDDVLEGVDFCPATRTSSSSDLVLVALPPNSSCFAPGAKYDGAWINNGNKGRMMRANGMLTANGSCMFSSWVINYSSKALGGLPLLS